MEENTFSYKRTTLTKDQFPAIETFLRFCQLDWNKLAKTGYVACANSAESNIKFYLNISNVGMSIFGKQRDWRLGLVDFW